MPRSGSFVASFRRSGRVPLIAGPGSGSFARSFAALGAARKQRFTIHLARLLHRLLFGLGLGLDLLILFFRRFLFVFLLLPNYDVGLLEVLRQLLVLGSLLRRSLLLRLLRSLGSLVVHREVGSRSSLLDIPEINHQPLAVVGRRKQLKFQQQQQQQHRHCVNQRRYSAYEALLRTVFRLKVNHRLFRSRCQNSLNLFFMAMFITFTTSSIGTLLSQCSDTVGSSVPVSFATSVSSSRSKETGVVSMK